MSGDMGDPPPTREGPHPALGVALGRRAEECAARVVERFAEFEWSGQAPSAAYLQSRYEHLWFGTLLVARWLVTGDVANRDELAWISTSGRSAAAEGLSVVNIARAYLVWRDVVIDTLTAEAARLTVPPRVLEQAHAVVRATCDGNLMRMTRSFDAHLKEIAASLEAERRNLREATLHDQLTGLANRVLLYDRLGHAIALSDRERTPLAVLLIDLDGFKAINDSLGHAYGDIALVEVATRFRKAVRRADTVARLGGDEFVVVLPRADRFQAMRVARKLLRTLREPVVMEGVSRALWASVGVAVHPEHGADPDSLLLAADQAMYAAKRNGGGAYACPPPDAIAPPGAA